MNISPLARLTALFSLLALSVFAADFAGKWTAQVPGRDGAMNATTFDLKVSGDAVTGSVTSPRGVQEITAGKVSGDEISFSTKANFNGNEFKINYKGKVAGGEIKFTREIEGRDIKSEFTAKRVS